MRRTILLITIFFALSACRCLAVPPPSASPEEGELISVIRDIGLQGDATKLEMVTAALQHSHHLVRMQALWTLARLGRPETIPAVEEQTTVRMWEVPTYAGIVAAQLRATAIPANDLAGVRQRMEALMQEVGMTPDQVKEILAKADPRESVYEDKERLAALWLLRELADLARAAAQRGMLNAATVSPVPLTLTPAAQTKAELSAYAPAKRIPLLIDTLARKRVLTFDDDFLIQLLINEGPAARPQIIARLEMMRQKTRNEHSAIGFAALFSALAGIGGEDAAATVGSFRNDEEERVRYYAKQTYEYLNRGQRRNQVIAY